MFPFTIQLKSTLTNNGGNIDKQKALLLLSKYVESHSGTNIYIAEDSLFFKPRFYLFANGWRKFGIIDKGEFLIKNNELIFKFYLYQMFFFALLFIFLFWSSTRNIFIALFLVLGVLGLNLIMAIIRYRNMMKQLTFMLSN